MEWEEISVDALGDKMSYGGGHFIVSSGMSHEIHVSKNDESWQRVALDGRGGIFNVIRGDTHWLAYGQSGFISEDGYQWTKMKSRPPHLDFLTFSQGIWFSTSGDGRIAFSEDAETWIKPKLLESNLRFRKVAVGKNQMVAASGQPFLLAAPFKSDPFHLQFERKDDALELRWNVKQGVVVLESASSMSGDWSPFLRVPSLDGLVRIPLGNSEFDVDKSKFIRAIIE